jgi:hypothetical protein
LKSKQLRDSADQSVPDQVLLIDESGDIGGIATTLSKVSVGEGVLSSRPGLERFDVSWLVRFVYEGLT